MITLRKAPAALLLALACSLAGCSTFQGAPKPLISPAKLESSAAFNVAGDIETLIKATDKNVRDAAAIRLLAVCDMRYVQFRHDIVANRKHTRAGANALTLMADIAAGLTDSVGVKDNYIALSALIQGGETIYDKDYLFDQTLDALVVQMDANRKSKLVDIHLALQRGVADYPGQAALSDVLDYYHAGTINAAILGVQKAASEQEARDSQTLRQLKAIGDAERKTIQDGTTALFAYVDQLQDGQIDAALSFLAGKNLPQSKAANLADNKKLIKEALTRLRREKYSDDVQPLLDELKAAIK
ncbi:MAG: hypothetical protein ACREP7_13865 [Lysobacter sp.]